MKKILLLVILALTIQTIKATVTATGHLTNEADNCSTELQATFTDNVANGTCEGSKIITRTWSLVDACGKAAATQTQTITVTDNTALVFDKLPEPTTIAHNATPLFQQATFTDACNKVTLTFNDISTTPNCDGSYSITRTWTANDGCNTSITSQIINVLPLVLVANNDMGLPINGSVGGISYYNILDNDTFDGVPITNPELVNITYTTSNPGITLNGTDVVVAAGTPAGVYTLVYEICSKSTTYTTCDAATVTVTVNNQIDAQDDTITEIDGAIGNPNAGNVLSNDTLNGNNLSINLVNLTITTPATSIGGAPVPDIDSIGQISIPPGTAGGTYTIVYQICDVINPTNCDSATVTIDVAFTPTPTAEAQIFCGTANVSSIVATGTDLKWYAAATGGTALTSDVALASRTYYVSQTLNTIESDRTAVVVTVNEAQISASASTVSSGTEVTLTASASKTGSSTLPANLQNGLVGYWPFNGDATDASGNGNNGTVNGATLTTDRFGNINNAYSFNSNSSIIPSNNVQNVINTFSYSAWVKPNTNCTIPNVSQTANAASNLSNNQCVIHPIHGITFGDQFSNAGSGLYVGTNGLYVEEHSGDWEAVPLNYVGTLNGWHLISIVYESKIPKLYIDGNYITTGIPSTLNIHISLGPDSYSSYNNSGFGAGYYPPIGTSQYFNGDIDELSFYNRALSPSEIQQLYSSAQTTYTWSTGETTATINPSPTETTTYWCDVTTNSVTCRKEMTITVASLGVEDNTIDLEIKVYPNPVKNTIAIEDGIINNIANQPYSITDALGKIVLKGKLNDGETAINVEHLSKGIYCIKIANNKASKFIKE